LELTSRGQACLLLINLTAGAAWLTGDINAQLATGMLGSVFFLDWIYKKLRAPKIEVSVKPRRTHAGRVFLDSLEVTNRAPFHSVHHVAISEPRLTTLAGGAYIEEIPPGGSWNPRVSARSRRRNRIRKRSFELSSSYPFAMFRWYGSVEVATDLISEPARVEVSRDLIESMGRGFQAQETGQRDMGSEFFCLREYQQGEDARHLHAARSASLGVLVTRRFRGDRDPEVAIILDLRRKPGTLVPLSNRALEQYLGITASLVDRLSSAASSVHIYTLDGKNRHWLIESPAEAREFLSYLAEASSVPYFPFDPTEHPELAGIHSHVWIPAGGYRPKAEERPTSNVLILEDMRA
jgi:uncharacterized protein (DUF58 family)